MTSTKYRRYKKAQIDTILTDIRGLMQQNVPDKEIINTLAIPARTLYRHKKRILQQNQKLWRELTSQYLETELLRLKDSLEYLYEVSLELAKKEDYEDRIGAAQSAADARLSLVQLLLDPEIIQKVQQHKSQKDILLQLQQPHP